MKYFSDFSISCRRWCLSMDRVSWLWPPISTGSQRADLRGCGRNRKVVSVGQAPFFNLGSEQGCCKSPALVGDRTAGAVMQSRGFGRMLGEGQGVFYGASITN